MSLIMWRKQFLFVLQRLIKFCWRCFFQVMNDVVCKVSADVTSVFRILNVWCDVGLVQQGELQHPFITVRDPGDPGHALRVSVLVQNTWSGLLLPLLIICWSNQVQVLFLGLDCRSHELLWSRRNCALPQMEHECRVLITFLLFCHSSPGAPGLIGHKEEAGDSGPPAPAGELHAATPTFPPSFLSHFLCFFPIFVRKSELKQNFQKENLTESPLWRKMDSHMALIFLRIVLLSHTSQTLTHPSARHKIFKTRVQVSNNETWRRCTTRSHPRTTFIHTFRNELTLEVNLFFLRCILFPHQVQTDLQVLKEINVSSRNASI